MVSLLARIINTYSRIIGRILMFILPITVLTGIIYLNIVQAGAPSLIPLAVDIAWYVFLFNCLILSFNGVLVSLSFDGEVKKLTKKGTPINSAVGFRNLEKKYKASNLYLLIILFFVVLAYGLYILSTYASADVAEWFGFSAEGLATLTFYLAISSIIFAFSATIIIKVPTLTGLTEGSLLQYYSASRHPFVLKSFISEAIYTLLDPITRVYFLQWSEIISNDICNDFSPKHSPTSERQSLAVHNVLVLLYLHYRFPEIIDKDNLEKELFRIVGFDTVEKIIYGDELNLKDWITIFEYFTKNSPEIFLIIDRIILTLTETPEQFDSKDFWISSAVPPIQKKEESQDILFFILNRKKGYTDPQRIKMSYHGADELSPHDLEIEFTIRAFDDFVTIPEDTSLFLTQELRQLIRLTTGILHQGTGIWLSVHSENIGSNLIAVAFTSDNEPIETQIFELRVVRGFKFYLQSWGPRILASLGIFLPIIRAILGF
ncbi:MAG: hypothetical protein KGD64_10515 [Candidatus Heimdallarchaeota archaeon]|nr:hypothetical protein [Candidatus Heimdallarchaeota archaeon]